MSALLKLAYDDEYYRERRLQRERERAKNKRLKDVAGGGPPSREEENLQHEIERREEGREPKFRPKGMAFGGLGGALGGAGYGALAAATDDSSLGAKGGAIAGGLGGLLGGGVMGAASDYGNMKADQIVKDKYKGEDNLEDKLEEEKKRRREMFQKANIQI